DSLAMKYKYTLAQIESITGKRLEKLHIIGGYANNEMLNQLTANATGIPVIAGPAEANAIGNIVMQTKPLATVKTLKDARSVVSDSFYVKIFLPEAGEQWKITFQKFEKLMEN